MAEYIEYLPVFGAIHDLGMDAFRRNDKKEARCYNKALNILCNAPAADVAPVVHGRWDSCAMTVPGAKGQTYHRYRCSKCHAKEKTKTDYCPNCGAHMKDGE